MKIAGSGLQSPFHSNIKTSSNKYRLFTVCSGLCLLISRTIPHGQCTISQLSVFAIYRCIRTFSFGTMRCKAQKRLSILLRQPSPFKFNRVFMLLISTFQIIFLPALLPSVCLLLHQFRYLLIQSLHQACLLTFQF